MYKKLTSIVISILIFITPCEAYSARGYALIELNTGRMLAGQNIYTRLPMASTTKIMTGLLACESKKFDNVYTVPAEAIRVEGSSMGLRAGEKITLRDLTYGLLLESGNDAANVIAYCLDGSIPAFAKRMNNRAAELGLKNTHFANPSGLDNEAHYTTALDLARLGAYAMQNKDFAKIASTYTAKITYDGNPDGRTLYNHNALLKTYEGTIGIKTGFTKRSGRCLVSCARRNGITLVAATLHGYDDWNDHKALLNYGFSVLKNTNLFTSYPDITSNVVGGTADKVNCSYSTDVTAGLKSDELSRVEMQINMPKFAYAPVKQGQKMGELIFTLDGKTLNKTDILADNSVAYKMEKPKPGMFDFFLKMFGKR